MFRRKIEIDSGLIAELTRLLEENNLTEIEVQRGDQRVRVARGGSATMMDSGRAAISPATAPTAPAAPAETKADLSRHPGVVTSPMVGTAYRASEPGAKPFVEEGATVTQGQTVLIVEAMKTMNAIPAPHAGKISRILVEDGQPVEYGEPLMILE